MLSVPASNVGRRFPYLHGGRTNGKDIRIEVHASDTKLNAVCLMVQPAKIERYERMRPLPFPFVSRFKDTLKFDIVKQELRFSLGAKTFRILRVCQMYIYESNPVFTK
jgi:hypothetical protein